MEKKRSFEITVWKQYSDEIEKAVSGYIEENFGNLDLRSRYVKSPDEAYLSQLNLHRVIAYDTPGDTITFDIIVVAEIEIFQTSHSEAIEGEAQKWFRVNCDVTLDNGYRDFQVAAIDEYDSHATNPRKILTDTLVPYIYADDLDKHADPHR